MKKSIFYFLAAFFAMSLFFVSCNDDDDKGGGGNEDVDTKIEELAMNEKWVNYLVAASSELKDDCESLWSEWETKYAETMKTAGPNNATYRSQAAAIEEIIQGCIDIAGEVGDQKIGGPYNLAKSGKTKEAVLEVESWYSWNSITDYSDNIISIRNSYLGGMGATTTQTNSISSFVKEKNAEVDAEVTTAINAAYDAISGMQFPFRNNLTGTKVETAMDACTDLVDVMEKKVLPLLDGSDYDFTAILANYTDNIVVPTYEDMKNKATAMHNACVTFSTDQTNQSKYDAACEAWKATRIPWERSEAFLFGPADVLGLDPSLDSWPLDQEDIYGILKDSKLSSVSQITGAITGEGVRGFHTVELLLFKNGENRKVK